MTEIFLDTNVIIQHPSVLSRVRPGDRYVIVWEVYDELMSQTRGVPGADHLRQLIEDAQKDGTVRLTEQDLGLRQFFKYSDVFIAAAAKASREQKNEVVIVSDDADMWDTAKTFEIPIITASQLQERLSATDTETNNKLLKSAKRVVREQTINIVISLLVGVAVSVLATFTPRALGFLREYFSVWSIGLLIVIVGACAFAARGRFKRTYGAAEVTIGLIVALREFFPDFDPQLLQFDDWLKVLAGIYVVVRGLDNFSKGCDGMWLEPYIRAFSGEKKARK